MSVLNIYATDKPLPKWEPTPRAPWPISRPVNPNAYIQYSRVILGAVWPPKHHLAALSSEDLLLEDRLASVSIPSNPDSVELTRQPSDACNSMGVRAASLPSDSSSNIDDFSSADRVMESEHSTRPASVELGMDEDEDEEKPVHLFVSSCDQSGSAPVEP
ncbi:hypothetical protein BDP27DRAFT_298840 [Rhodocollybia butyracea]|uniref:Uncharacterized protein n=1 Tax=Rhodocollybia butyracea TaxID=206335 RepID=A0A9P5PVQ0_9AGAR|nr:hypothetical protein BDP27DRAFT_298840 [Rhodocollybia butyracea]